MTFIYTIILINWSNFTWTISKHTYFVIYNMYILIFHYAIRELIMFKICVKCCLPNENNFERKCEGVVLSTPSSFDDFVMHVCDSWQSDIALISIQTCWLAYQSTIGYGDYLLTIREADNIFFCCEEPQRMFDSVVPRNYIQKVFIKYYYKRQTIVAVRLFIIHFSFTSIYLVDSIYIYYIAYIIIKFLTLYNSRESLELLIRF